MKKIIFSISVLFTAIIITLFSYIKYQQIKEEKVANIAVDKIMERQENDEMLQFVREFLNDSTIQIVDAEKGILRKDSICFFYDTKWDTYLVVPDSFILEIPEDHSSLNLIYDDSKKEDTSYYFYLKIKPLSDDTDLFISYQTLSECKQDAIIRNVIKQFPDKPF